MSHTQHAAHQAVHTLEGALGGEADQSLAVPNLAVPPETETPTDEKTLHGSTFALNKQRSTGSPSLTSGSAAAHDPLEPSDEKQPATAEQTRAEAEAAAGILTGTRLYLVFLSMMLAVLLFALDQSIVSTAIPVIVSDFNAFDKVSWIITAYFLTQCGLILLVGQLLTVIKPKWMLLTAVFFFELGSLICGVAPNMTALIVARAIQGIGASGMFVSILAIIAVITKLEQRSAFFASFGFVFVISSVVGPLLGGVFTQHVTWRWCFYINLPVGGIAAVAIVFLLPARDTDQTIANKDKTILQKLAVIDYLGSALIMLCITCLLLALQWGGNDYRWDSWRIILLFVLGGVLAILFGAWQYWRNETALLPRNILANRTGIAASIAIFMTMLAMLGGTYQLPLFYQAGRGHSPEKSGIDIIPFMLSVCVGIFISGGLVTKFGRYYPFPLIGLPIAAVGFGLLYTIKAETANSKVIGFQILAGFGIGLAFQNIIMSIQAEYADRPHLMPQATGMVSFFQLAGAAIGIGIVNTVQSVILNTDLRKDAPNAPFELIRQSPTAIYTLPVDERPPVIKAYIAAITHSFVPIYIAIAIGLVGAIFMRNWNMLTRGGAGGGHAAV